MATLPTLAGAADPPEQKINKHRAAPAGLLALCPLSRQDTPGGAAEPVGGGAGKPRGLATISGYWEPRSATYQLCGVGQVT